MALWDRETDILDHFCFLFRERYIIEVNRCVRDHEEIKVISKDEAEEVSKKLETAGAKAEIK